MPAFCGIGPGLQRSECLLPCALLSVPVWASVCPLGALCSVVGAALPAESPAAEGDLLEGILPPAVARLPGSQPRAQAAAPAGVCSPLPLSLCFSPVQGNQLPDRENRGHFWFNLSTGFCLTDLWSRIIIKLYCGSFKLF